MFDYLLCGIASAIVFLSGLVPCVYDYYYDLPCRHDKWYGQLQFCFVFFTIEFLSIRVYLLLQTIKDLWNKLDFSRFLVEMISFRNQIANYQITSNLSQPKHIPTLNFFCKKSLQTWYII